MTNTQKDSVASFSPTLGNVIFITVVSWAPLLWVLIPVLLNGGINEESLGTGTRYYRSPEAYFSIMALCTLVFIYTSFIPMCLSFVRGYFVKFCDDFILFKRTKITIGDIERIETSWLFGKFYKFVLKNGKNVVIPSGINRNKSDYIDNRFRNLIVS